MQLSKSVCWVETGSQRITRKSSCKVAKKNLLKINNKKKYVNEMSFTEIHKVIENQLTRHINE